MAMIEEREELMVPPTTSGGTPTMRKAHFIKPLLNPTSINQPIFPKLCSPSWSLNPCMYEHMRKRVLFKGRIKPQKAWNTWVEKLQKTHQKTWQKAGIFDAIRASTYKINKHDELIIRLAEKWCPETNTFVFSWGETTITLEDVMILGGFSVLGDSVQRPEKKTEDEEIEKKLYDAFRQVGKTSSPSYLHQWINYFKGGSGDMENVALIALWLSRYVLLTHLYHMISPSVFPIAISLARGTRVALAPAVLASVYRDFSSLSEKIVTWKSKGGYDCLDLVLCAPFDLVQIWAWERFPRLSPKPTSLVHGDESRLARWHGVNRGKIGRPRVDIEFTGDDFLWRPYARHLENWKFPKFYSDQEMWVSVNSEVDDELLSFARCLMPCELVGVDCFAQYLPHRVAMQYGMDQDVPHFIPRSNDDYDLAWNSYDRPLDDLKLYVPPRLFEGDVTVEYANWWKAMLSLHDETVIVCETQGRSKRQGKKISQISHGRFSPPLVESRLEKATEISPTFEGMAPQHTLVVNEDEAISNVIPLMETKDTQLCEHIAKEGDEEMEVAGNTMNVDHGSNHLQQSHSQNELSPVNDETVRVTELLTGPDMKKSYSAVAEDEAEEDSEGAIMKQVNNSVADPVVLDDDDDDEVEKNDGYHHFEALISGIDARISKLESTVPFLKGAIFGSKAR